MTRDHVVERRAIVHFRAQRLVFQLFQEGFFQFVERYFEIVRDRKVRHQRLVFQRIRLHFSGDLGRRSERFGMIREQRGHLLFALQILLERVPHPIRIVQADQPVVRRRVVGHDEMHVVRRDVLDAVFGRQPQDHFVDLFLVLVHLRVDPRVTARMQLQFEVVILSENRLKLLDDAVRLVDIPVHDRLRKLPAETGRAADNPVMVQPQQLFIHTRTVIESLDKGVRNDTRQVMIPFQVLGQQDQVVAAVVLAAFVETAAARNVHLASEDRFDPLFFGRIVKLLHAEHVAVIGNRQRRHAQFFGAFEQRFDRSRPVQDRILGMYVQMCKLSHFRFAFNDVSRQK